MKRDRSVRTCLIGPRSLCTAGIAATMTQSSFSLVLHCERLDEFEAAAPHIGPSLCVYVATSGSPSRSLMDVAGLRRSAATMPIVVLSDQHDDRPAFMAAGADGHLTSDASPDALLLSLKRFADRASLSATGSDGSSAGPNAPASVRNAVSDTLSVRETEVVAAIAQGRSNKCVARQLSIAETTVKAHVRTILTKIGVANRTQMALWLARHGRHHAQAYPTAPADPSDGGQRLGSASTMVSGREPDLTPSISPTWPMPR